MSAVNVIRTSGDRQKCAARSKTNTQSSRNLHEPTRKSHLHYLAGNPVEAQCDDAQTRASRQPLTLLSAEPDKTVPTQRGALRGSSITTNSNNSEPAPTTTRRALSSKSFEPFSIVSHFSSSTDANKFCRKLNQHTCKRKPSATRLPPFLLITAIAVIIQVVPIVSKSIQNEPIDSIERNSVTQSIQQLQTFTEQPELSTRKTTSLENLFRQSWSALGKKLPFISPESPSTTTTTAPPPTTTIAVDRNLEETTTTVESSGQDESSSERDDDDAESCSGLSVGDGAEAANLTDNARLVNLQNCIQRKVKRTIMKTTRKGMEMFDKLQLSGGCTSSLFNLMSSLTEMKSYAFKFLDASAKVPSGMMYGLLSDFGDFDECLSIRSNPNVALDEEAEEGAFSGKYCLMSVKMNYHAKLATNETVPEGIIEDGLLWDELIRHYWTTNSSKGFQIGVCVPSRCSNDDLNQLYRQIANQYNLMGDIINCQDARDLRTQSTADTFQSVIIYAFYSILALMVIGTMLDRYYSLPLAIEKPLASLGGKAAIEDKRGHRYRNSKLAFVVKILTCFSITRNWTIFMRKDNHHNARQWHSLIGSNFTIPSDTTRQTAKKLSSSLSSSSSTSSYSEDQTDCDTEASGTTLEVNETADDKLRELTVRVQPDDYYCSEISALNQLSGLRLFVIIWITIGYSFLYPSANNYQYYRSIINMNITRDSVWFATTNFTLGIDMLLYMTGLGFVWKLAFLVPKTYQVRDESFSKWKPIPSAVLQLILKKVLRFWPTYLTVIGIAIVVPLLSDGPMWPEMVSKRIGDSCRRNWWTNLLFINNILGESEICLPSSWFVSILMQLFIIGSAIMILVHKFSLKVGLAALTILLIASCTISFLAAYLHEIRAPMIRMDESFVMELDENIFGLYTNIFNNLGPFLIGMSGGFLLVNAQIQKSNSRNKVNSPGKGTTLLRCLTIRMMAAIMAATIAVLVLSSVFVQDYSLLLGSIYWSLHRVGWAIFTGYIIHNLALGRWKLLSDFLSLSTFTPVSRLIPIAYLIYPIFIHMHSGLVRDGLHVSIYNMLNIYITRLVMTFTTALVIHLLVELPVCSIEEILLDKWLNSIGKSETREKSNKFHPLLTVAPNLNLQYGEAKEAELTGNNSGITKPEVSPTLERSISEDSGTGE